MIERFTTVASGVECDCKLLLDPPAVPLQGGTLEEQPADRQEQQTGESREDERLAAQDRGSCRAARRTGMRRAPKGFPKRP